MKEGTPKLQHASQDDQEGLEKGVDSPNYLKAKELREDWREYLDTPSSVNQPKNSEDFQKIKQLPDGPRYPTFMSKGFGPYSLHEKVALLPQIKKYLDKTPVHIHSGQIYGDLVLMESELKAQEEKFRSFKFKPEKNPQNISLGVETVLSSSQIYFVDGEYVAVSNSSYYTGDNPSQSYVVLFKSKEPIEFKITRGGNVENYTLGKIELVGNHG